MENSRITKYSAELEKAIGDERAMLRVLERIRLAVCSAYTARGWLETTEQFLGREPEIAEFIAWTKAITLTRDYALVR